MYINCARLAVAFTNRKGWLTSWPTYSSWLAYNRANRLVNGLNAWQMGLLAVSNQAVTYTYVCALVCVCVCALVCVFMRLYAIPTCTCTYLVTIDFISQCVTLPQGQNVQVTGYLSVKAETEESFMWVEGTVLLQWVPYNACTSLN